MLIHPTHLDPSPDHDVAVAVAGEDLAGLGERRAVHRVRPGDLAREEALRGGNSLGYFGPKNGPKNGPNIGPRRNMYGTTIISPKISSYFLYSEIS